MILASDSLSGSRQSNAQARTRSIVSVRVIALASAIASIRSSSGTENRRLVDTLRSRFSVPSGNNLPKFARSLRSVCERLRSLCGHHRHPSLKHLKIAGMSVRRSQNGRARPQSLALVRRNLLNDGREVGVVRVLPHHVAKTLRIQMRLGLRAEGHEDRHRIREPGGPVEVEHHLRTTDVVGSLVQVNGGGAFAHPVCAW